MKKANIQEHGKYQERGIYYVENKKGNRTRHVLCKGIYTDTAGEYFAAFQYVDKKATRQNKRVTVSGKSPFWFIPTNQPLTY